MRGFILWLIFVWGLQYVFIIFLRPMCADRRLSKLLAAPQVSRTLTGKLEVVAVRDMEVEGTDS